MGGEGWATGDYLDRPLRDLLGDVSGADPVPAAGSLAAATGALAAGLVAKVARRSVSRLEDADATAARADRLRERLEPVITGDAAAYSAALAARTRGADDTAAMRTATAGPATIAETAARIAELAADLAATGNPNLRHDAVAAATIAAATAEVAASLAAANTGDTRDTGPARDARTSAAAATDAAGRADSAASGPPGTR